MSAPKRRKISSPAQPSRSDQQVQLDEHEIKLVQWEEWALSTEEHFHAVDLHARLPNGAPMGHVHR